MFRFDFGLGKAYRDWSHAAQRIENELSRGAPANPEAYLFWQETIEDGAAYHAETVLHANYLRMCLCLVAAAKGVLLHLIACGASWLAYRLGSIDFDTFTLIVAFSGGVLASAVIFCLLFPRTGIKLVLAVND